MFIRRVFQGEHTACVTSKLCLEGIGATVPDLQEPSQRAGDKGGAGQGEPY